MALMNPVDRRTLVISRRRAALKRSTARPFPAQTPNGDETFPYLFSFTKGLCHGRQGLLEDPRDFEQFGVATGTPDPAVFDLVPLNTSVTKLRAVGKDVRAKFEDPARLFRQYESPTGGLPFVLQGPDPFALAMPPAPKAGSNELCAEMAEVYTMALLRDLPVAAFMSADLIESLDAALGEGEAPVSQEDRAAVDTAAARLACLPWFDGRANGRDEADPWARQRRRFDLPQGAANLFRGLGEDAWDTPFLSQFMVIGSGARDRDFAGRETGHIGFGNQRIDQRVRVAIPGKDYMETWDEWLDVQNAYNARDAVRMGAGEFEPGAWRPISRLRDLATYVHDDALYQAYLNAALILWGEGAVPIDSGLPFHGRSDLSLAKHNQDPFAVFGAPHLLTLVTEASSRALRAVRLQKFSVHRRLRPEALAALFHTARSGFDPSGEGAFSNDIPVESAARQQITEHILPLYRGANAGMDEILEAICAKTGGTCLLPMAFPEGSPMHPSYGAGHATVAGACVTMLKAFFAMEETASCGTPQPTYLVPPGGKAYVPTPGESASDTGTRLVGIRIENGLTVESELNKLAWNISNARNIAGVHYYTDYIESLLLGEAISLGILREQMLTYDPAEQVTMTVPLYVERCLPDVLCGPYLKPDDPVGKVRIRSDGHLEPVAGGASLAHDADAHARLKARITAQIAAGAEAARVVV